MRLVWKIALGVVAAVVLVGVGGFLFLLFKPDAAAELAGPGPSGVRITENGIFGNYYTAPKTGSAHPAVLVLGGSEGGLYPEVTAEAEDLQKRGFNVLQLAYFNAPGKSSKLERVPLEQFYTALDWLKRQPGTDANRIGIMGYSKGAEGALLVATRYPGLKAMVLGDAIERGMGCAVDAELYFRRDQLMDAGRNRRSESSLCKAGRTREPAFPLHQCAQGPASRVAGPPTRGELQGPDSHDLRGTRYALAILSDGG